MSWFLSSVSQRSAVKFCFWNELLSNYTLPSWSVRVTINSTKLCISRFWLQANTITDTIRQWDFGGLYVMIDALYKCTTQWLSLCCRDRAYDNRLFSEMFNYSEIFFFITIVLFSFYCSFTFEWRWNKTWPNNRIRIDTNSMIENARKLPTKKASVTRNANTIGFFVAITGWSEKNPRNPATASHAEEEARLP